MWIQPIIDRIQADVDYAKEHAGNVNEHHKGAQGHIDWLRLTGNMFFLILLLSKYQYNLSITCRNDWKLFEIFKNTDIEQVKRDLQRIRNMIPAYSIPDIPELPLTHYEKINICEELVLDIEKTVHRLKGRFKVSGTFRSGQRLHLPHFYYDPYLTWNEWDAMNRPFNRITDGTIMAKDFFRWRAL